MPKAFVNGVEVEFDAGSTVLQVCENAGEEIPRFCYHERLKIAGNCRMCLVQVEGGPPKPAASCAMPAAEGMKIHTNTPMVKKAREGVMEFLLANHPLDCPICDQAGECDLQDQSMAYGRGESRYDEHKRAVKDKYMGPIVKTQMTRCIHCTRCIRFMDEVAGVSELGATFRGEHMEVGTYIEKGLSSEMSGNIVDLCPVGALTSKPYAYKARPWELKKTETIDISDATGTNIRIDTRGNEVLRVLPRINEEINEEWISDKTRFIFEGLKYQRLDKPYVKKDGKLKATTWEKAISAVSEKLLSTKSDKIAAIAGDLVDVESTFALKALLDNLGVKNYDCRQDGAAYDNTNRATYIFNTAIAGIENADSILLIGTNPRFESAILNSRIRKTVVAKNIPVAVIGSKIDLNYKYSHLGSEISTLEQILDGSNEYSKVLEKSKTPVIIIGNSVYKRADAFGVIELITKIAEKYGVVGGEWNGLNALQKAAGRTGALDVGFVPAKNGMNISQMQVAGRAGEIEVLISLGADEIDYKNFEKSFKIYIGSHGDNGAHNADVILPAAAYTEKSATYVNLEGRAQRTVRATFPVGEAKEDFEIIKLIATAANKDPYNSIEEIRAALEKLSPVFKNIDAISGVAKWPSASQLPQAKLTKSQIETEQFNFYFTDPISRVSKTMEACNNEFGEEKGFWKKDKAI